VGFTGKNLLGCHKVRSEEIRRKTRLQKLELIIKGRRLSWLGYTLRMVDFRIPRQAIQWELRATRESRDSQGKIGRTSSDEI